MQFIGVVGLALATGIVAWVQFYLNLVALRNHPSAHFDEKFLWNVPRIIFSAALMGVLLFGLTSVSQGLIFGDSTGMKVAVLGGIIAIGGGAYVAAIFMTGVLSVADVKRYFVRRTA